MNWRRGARAHYLNVRHEHCQKIIQLGILGKTAKDHNLLFVTPHSGNVEEAEQTTTLSEEDVKE